jgi:hypothetical protein
MPVERFRSIEEMNAAPIRGAERNAFERFVRHCARYRLISPRKYPRGVFRFRSLEEAQASRAEIPAEIRRVRDRLED